MVPVCKTGFSVGVDQMGPVLTKWVFMAGAYLARPTGCCVYLFITQFMLKNLAAATKE